MLNSGPAVSMTQPMIANNVMKGNDTPSLNQILTSMSTALNECDTEIDTIQQSLDVLVGQPATAPNQIPPNPSYPGLIGSYAETNWRLMTLMQRLRTVRARLQSAV